MYPTSMCGKPHPTSFRTLAHSGRVCRLLSEPETGSFLPCSGDADIVADQPAGPVHAIFGGVPRPTPRGVLDSSPYAYLEAVSLVLALVAVLARSQDRPFAAIEEALALRELVQGQGLSQHELARRCGRDVSWVSRRLQLLSGLPDEALAAVRAGRLSSWAANRVVAPLARANSDHANRLLERLVTEPLSTRELRDWFQHYERALVGVREEMVRRPRLFIQAQDEIRQERATQRLRQGPEGQCATDVRILESVLGRLVQRTADLRPVPKGVIRAAPRLQAALNKLTSIINREDGHDPDRYPRRGADPDGAGPWRARDQPSSEVVAEHGAADSAGAGAGQG